MGIKGKRGFDAESAHDLKAHAIDQTEISPSCRKDGTDAGTMNFPANKIYVYDGHNIFFQKPYRRYPQSALCECETFHENVIAGNESFITF